MNSEPACHHRNKANQDQRADDAWHWLFFGQMFDSEANGFVKAQAAGKQQCKKRPISLALELLAVRSSPEREALRNGRSVALAPAEISNTLDAANPSGEIGA
jgi:hypothetical protein